MGNMSYCRFENTAGDLQDCLEALYEQQDEDTLKDALSSEQETRARRRLVQLCHEVAGQFEVEDVL